MNKQFELQEYLFEGERKRTDLINFVASLDPSYRVAIYRNHSFELIENTITPYLEYAGLGVEFSYSSYDDSLSFLELDTSVDLVILWLDLTAYNMTDVQGFIEDRLNYLRGVFDKNILFVPCGDHGEFITEGTHTVLYSLEQIQSRLGESFFDLRLEPFSGTKLSSVASFDISRDLGLNYLPALLKPTLKGIVVDLDNTLYQGVLGEDGVDGLVLTQGHRDLQATLKRLSQQGFFLCIASKNDERDVVSLFEGRSDFPLGMADFVNVQANWDSKADSISTIAQALNISTDSLLFIDDNMGEIVSVLSMHPSINVIWAKESASITHDVVSNYPGLLKLDAKKEDGLRKKDTLANQKRLEMQASMSQESYIKGLQMALVYELDNLEQVARVTELSNKTNQFIFSYQRYSQSQVESLMQSDAAAVVAISLSDRLSDSGVIGVVVVHKHENAAVLEECFVSCRALGRGIDQAIVLGGINVALESLGLEQLRVEFTNGERNLPAEKFCQAHLNAFTQGSDTFDYQIPTDLIDVTINSNNIT